MRVSRNHIAICMRNNIKCKTHGLYLPCLTIGTHNSNGKSINQMTIHRLPLTYVVIFFLLWIYLLCVNQLSFNHIHLVHEIVSCFFLFFSSQCFKCTSIHVCNVEFSSTTFLFSFHLVCACLVWSIHILGSFLLFYFILHNRHLQAMRILYGSRVCHTSSTFQMYNQ